MNKDEYKIYAADVIKDLSNRIDELKQRAEGVNEKVKGEFKEKMTHLEELRDELMNQLEEFDDIPENRWEETKQEFVKGIEFIKQGFQKLFSILSR